MVIFKYILAVLYGVVCGIFKLAMLSVLIVLLTPFYVLAMITIGYGDACSYFGLEENIDDDWFNEQYEE